MHPSTQVTQRPLRETMESSVLFLVNVAADAFILDKDINPPCFESTSQVIRDWASNLRKKLASDH
jgi:hypothetical protein